MSVIFVLILVSMVVAALFLGAFFWAVRSGQYDDTYTPSVRMLFEEPKEEKPPEDEGKKETPSSPE